MKRQWADDAYEALRDGRGATVQPRGRSMRGLITDNAHVTLEPYGNDLPAVGHIVLARVCGRRFSHLVLHLVIAQESGRYLIGNSEGRSDGWVTAQEIFGRAVSVIPLAGE